MSESKPAASSDDEVRLIDAICHYRAKAIMLGAKPTDMLTPFDRELCEKGIPDDIGAAFDVTDIWDELEKAEKERDELRAEVERLRGAKPELPPRQPDGKGLPRYGLRWNGPVEPIAVPMDDGYWTPWHLADAETRRGEIEREHTGRALEDAIALQRAACAVAYQRGAEAMREAAANWLDAPYENIDAAIRNLPIPEDKP